MSEALITPGQPVRFVLELKAEEGDRVKAGQTLVRLDGRGFKLQAERDAITASMPRIPSRTRWPTTARSSRAPRP